MSRRDQQLGIVPVWRKKVDRRVFVLALLALVDQLVAEEKASEPTQLRDSNPNGKQGASNA